MAVLARGAVTDRPWGMTLGALGMRGLTGQLTLTADGKQYKVAFQSGIVIGAYSPLATDAAVRLALTGTLITSSQVNDIMRRIASSPQRDEIEVLAEACNLQPDQALRLRRRHVAQCAARTFAIDQGEFVVEDQISVAATGGSQLDVRTIIFLGAKTNMSEERLEAELAQMGAWFKIKPDATSTVAQYGFTEETKPVLRMLAEGANIAEIEQANASLGRRLVRAIAYSLASCGACEAVAGPPRAPSASVPPQNVRPAATTLSPHTVTSGITPTQHKTAPLGSRSPAAPSVPPATRGATSSSPPVSRASTGSTPPAERSGTGSSPPVSRSSTGDIPTVGRSPSGTHAAVGRASTGTIPVINRVGTSSEPVTPRTITESSGVPRSTDGRGSGSSPAVARTGSPGIERSPSGGTVAPQDRSPSGGVPRPRSGTSRPVTAPPTSRTTTQSSGCSAATARRRSPRGPHRRPRPLRVHSASSMPPLASTPSRPPARARREAAAPRRPKQNTAATLEIESMLANKIPMLERGVDYYTLFGLPIGATPEEVRSTYLMLARKLHPDRLAAIGVDDDDRQAQRLMACINEAFAVLNDPIRRAEYLSILQRGGEAVVREEQQKADELAMRVMRAEEAFRLGEMALRRDQIAQAVQQFTIAVELAPNEAEYQALLAWAQFAAAPDKNVRGCDKALLRAADTNDCSPKAF